MVEDCISAIKCSRICDAMPVLGSHVGNSKLASLSQQYGTLIFWLDSDKYKEAQNAAERANLLGVKTKVIYTDLDPKEYDNVAIQERLDT